MTRPDQLNNDREDPWERLFTSDKAYRVEILRGLLEGADIPCVVMNKQDSSYITIGEIDLLVKRSDILRANQIVHQFLERE